MSIFVSSSAYSFSFDYKGREYKLKSSIISSQEYFELNSVLKPSNIKPVYNRILHKLSFQKGDETVILSVISDLVLAKGEFKSFKKPLLYQDGKFYISRSATVFLTKILDYKIERPVLIIDPGHGGTGDDGLGAIAKLEDKTIYEKELTLNFSKIFGAELEARGYEVRYTRISDVKIDLKSRTKMANSGDGILFISIHVNSSGDNNTKGLDVFYMSENAEDEYSSSVADFENKFIDTKEIPKDETSKIIRSMLATAHIRDSAKLAYDISSNIPTKFINRGVKKAPFSVLSGATMPAVLIELGFMSNNEELKRMQNDAEQLMLAEGFANGISIFLETYKKELEL